MKKSILTSLYFLLMLPFAAYSQGFSIELQDWREIWRKVIEDKDGRIVSAGFFKPTATSNFLELNLLIHSAQGQLLNTARVNIPGADLIHALVENDSNYVVFYGDVSNPLISISQRRSIHFKKDLSSYTIRTWGDTTRRGLIKAVKPAANKRDWLMIELNRAGGAGTPSQAEFYRLSNDFNQVLAYKKFRVEYDSTINPILSDVIEIPQNKGYAFLFNGAMVDDTMYYSWLYSILVVDSNMQETKRVLAESFPGQASSARLGVLSQNIKGGLALESDSVLLLYGNAYFYQFNRDNTNICRTDTCVRQIRTRWSLPDLQLVGATVSPWIGKPAYHEGVELLGGTRHLVWGSIGRDDLVKNGLQDYETGISIEEWIGNQRSLRRELSQNGYWFRPSSVKKARNGDYIITSRQNNFLNNGNIEHQPMLTRVDSAGQFMVFSENLVEVPLKVWPNPVHGRILRMELIVGNPCQVALLGVQGRSRWVGTRSAQDSQLDLSDTPSGIYFLRITQPGQPPQVTKVVLP